MQQMALAVMLSFPRWLLIVIQASWDEQCTIRLGTQVWQHSCAMIVRSRQVTKNILVKEMARSGLVDAAKLTGPRPRETLAVTLGAFFTAYLISQRLARFGQARISSDDSATPARRANCHQ